MPKRSHHAKEIFFAIFIAHTSFCICKSIRKSSLFRRLIPRNTQQFNELSLPQNRWDTSKTKPTKQLLKNTLLAVAVSSRY